ncbi:MAG: hypothetical protein CFE24_13050 [Flavobacterium sp. BFFFF2]|nr:MAG: hypothetical protein CFE24_13050 [Flavobacterium sp. BFFFF2]
MKKGELILGALAGVAIVFDLLLIPGGNQFFIVVFLALAMLYLGFGFVLFNGIRLRNMFEKGMYKNISLLRIFGAIGAGLALFMALIGLVFKFQSYPGSFIMLLFGFSAILLVSLVCTIKLYNDSTGFYRGIFSRCIAIGGICLVLLFAPTTLIEEIKYRNYPEYIIALKNAIAAPNNAKLQVEAVVARQKMKQKMAEE